MSIRDESEWERHESYGMLRFSRITGSSSRLFGSSINHGFSIEFQLFPGRVNRSHHENMYSRDGMKPIAVARMSPAQFATLLTSMEASEGVPVTITRVGGKAMEPPPFRDENAQTVAEFEERMDEVLGKINSVKDEVIKILDERKLPKGFKERVLSKIEDIMTEMRYNLPFVGEQFQRTVEKTVIEAKAEVDSFITAAIQKTGIAALRKKDRVMLPTIDIGDDD